MPKTTRGELPKGLAMRSAGLSLVHQQGPTPSLWGAAALSRGQGLLTGTWTSARYQDHYAIGYSNQGLVFRIQNELAIGARIKIWEDHGPMARLGWAMDWRGSRDFAQLWIRVPELQLGWSGFLDGLQYDIAATASPYTYRMHKLSPAAAAKAHAASAGAVGSLGWRRWRLNARMDWSFHRSGRGHSGQGDLCAMLWRHAPRTTLQNRAVSRRHRWFGDHAQRYRAALCATGRTTQAILSTRGSQRPWQAGLQIMIGKISFLDPSRG